MKLHNVSGTCSDLAAGVQERVGDKLIVRSLRDPELQEWRERSLGPTAPWAPTLFETDGKNVRTWIGWQMGVMISRSLGPIADLPPEN